MPWTLSYTVPKQAHYPQNLGGFFSSFEKIQFFKDLI